MSGRLDPKKRSNLIPKGEKGKCRWCMKPVPKGRFSWCSQACVDDALIRTQPGYARKKVEERDKGVCAECGLDTRALENSLRRLRALALNGLDAYDRTSNKAARRYGMTINRLYDVVTAGKTDFEAALEEIAREGRPHPVPGFLRYRQDPLPVTVAEQRVRRIHKRLMKLADARQKRLASEMTKRGFDGVGSRFGGVSRSLWDADHILPVVKGGGGCGLENYRTLCQPCHKTATAALAARRALERRGLDPDAPDPQQALPL